MCRHGFYISISIRNLIFADPRRSVKDALSGITGGSSVNGSEIERAMQRLLETN